MERQERATVNSRQARTNSEILNFIFIKETKNPNIQN
jgi:hypothetical protein